MLHASQIVVCGCFSEINIVVAVKSVVLHCCLLRSLRADHEKLQYWTKRMQRAVKWCYCHLVWELNLWCHFCPVFTVKIQCSQVSSQRLFVHPTFMFSRPPLAFFFQLSNHRDSGGLTRSLSLISHHVTLTIFSWICVHLFSYTFCFDYSILLNLKWSHPEMPVYGSGEFEFHFYLSVGCDRNLHSYAQSIQSKHLFSVPCGSLGVQTITHIDWFPQPCIDLIVYLEPSDLALGIVH